MPEITGAVNAIKDWENICQGLVSLGMAELIKDGQGIGIDGHGDSKDYVKVYNIFIGSGLDFKRVAWRFHYDERPNAKSSFRVSDIGMEAMLKSITVMGVLRKLNMKISNGDRYDIEKLREVMKEALNIVENRKSEVRNHEIVAEAKKA